VTPQHLAHTWQLDDAEFQFLDGFPPYSFPERCPRPASRCWIGATSATQPVSLSGKDEEVLVRQKLVFLDEPKPRRLHLQDEILACNLHLQGWSNRQFPFLEINQH